MQGPFFKLRNPPLGQLCQRYGKPVPTLDQLQGYAEEFEFPFYRQDGPAVRGTNGGPFVAAMALAIQKHLGLNPWGMEEISMTAQRPDYLTKRDFFGSWVEMIDGLLHTNFRISPQSLLDERQVTLACNDIEIAFGHQLEKDENPNSPRLTKGHEPYLHDKGRENYPVGDTTYHELLLRWWGQNKCTVMRAWRSKTCVGATVLLPISAETLEGLRQGHIAVREIRANHILNKSTHFFVEAGTDRPLIESENLKTRSKAVLATLLAQLAIGVPPGKENELRGLSFAPCKTSETRLSDGGFTHTGGMLKDTDFPLMEFGPNTPWIEQQKMAAGIKTSRSVNHRLFDHWKN